LRQNLENQVPRGVLVFTLERTLPHPEGDWITKQKLKYCANLRLEETSVDELLNTSRVVDLATSDCFSNEKKTAFINYSNRR
jgi:hypothetical protein